MSDGPVSPDISSNGVQQSPTETSAPKTRLQNLTELIASLPDLTEEDQQLLNQYNEAKGSWLERQAMLPEGFHKKVNHADLKKKLPSQVDDLIANVDDLVQPSLDEETSSKLKSKITEALKAGSLPHIVHAMDLRESSLDFQWKLLGNAMKTGYVATEDADFALRGILDTAKLDKSGYRIKLEGGPHYRDTILDKYIQLGDKGYQLRQTIRTMEEVGVALPPSIRGFDNFHLENFPENFNIQ